jgi:hypothetical protein
MNNSGLKFRIIFYSWMQQSHSWKADNRSVGQEIPSVFMEAESSLPCTQQPVTGSCSEPDELVHSRGLFL